MSGTIVTLSGPPGSGKSQVASALEQAGMFAVVTNEELSRLHEHDSQDLLINYAQNGHHCAIRKSDIDTVLGLGRVPVVIVPTEHIDRVITHWPDSFRVYLHIDPADIDANLRLNNRLTERHYGSMKKRLRDADEAVAQRNFQHEQARHNFRNSCMQPSGEQIKALLDTLLRVDDEHKKFSQPSTQKNFHLVVDMSRSVSIYERFITPIIAFVGARANTAPSRNGNNGNHSPYAPQH